MAKGCVADKTPEIEDAGASCIAIPPERVADPFAYADAARHVVNEALAERISPLDATRLRAILNDACTENTGLSIQEAGRQSLDAIERIINVLESPKAELEILKTEIAKIDDIRLTGKKKREYLQRIDDVISLQEQAVADPAKFWVYVGRDSEATSEVSQARNGIFDMQPFHIKMFDVWNNALARYSLTEAPPGHAKSTNMRGYVTWRVGRQPKMRILMLADAQNKSEKEVLAQLRIITSPRYHAIFPKIKVLGRMENVKQSAHGFTLASTDGDREDFNIFSREPTVEGYAVGSQINGSGYDMIVGDDIVLPEARTQDFYRNDTNRRWEGVIRQRLRNPAVAEVKLVATPWHTDDVYGRIEKRQRDSGSRRWKIIKFPILEGEDGHEIPIWPSKYSQEMLDEEKATSQPAEYSCLFRLDPHHTGSKTVKKIHYYHAEDNELATEKDRKLQGALLHAERWLSIDLSGSANKDSADNGICDVVMSPSGFAYVTESIEIRMAPVEFRDWVLQRITSAPGTGYAGIQVEGQGSQAGHAQLFLDDIRKMLAEQGRADTIAFVMSNARVGSANSNRSKEQRLAASAWLMESGRVRFAGFRYRRPASAETGIKAVPNSGVALLIDAMRNFNTTTHKDIVDALTQFLLHNRNRIADATPPTEQPVELVSVDPRTRQLKKQLDAMAAGSDDRYDDEAAFMQAWSA